MKMRTKTTRKRRKERRAFESRSGTAGGKEEERGKAED